MAKHNNTILIRNIMGVTALVLLGTGCQPMPKSSTKSQTGQAINTNLSSASVALSPSGNPNTSQNLSQNLSPESINIAQRLEISYARNAAYKKDECPKLVEFESVNQTVTREAEQLPTDYCEYFVFLDKGDTLSIETNDDMHAKLISPIWFDFSNGSYTAQKYDKYTIRLSYYGVRYHPANFRYDIRLVKSSIKKVD